MLVIEEVTAQLQKIGLVDVLTPIHNVMMRSTRPAPN
jgi:hypothetical protein